MVKFLTAIIIFLTAPASVMAYGNNLALQIFMPREAGTGSPAISTHHRCFRAYTGLEYRIRVQAVGGLWPYTYSLSNAPAGMTVDSNGYIIWDNPQSSASNITIRVTDQDSDYVEQTWDITVGTSGFRFVDCTEGTNGDGTISSPYNSIANMATSSASTDIVYFRDGTCAVPTRGIGPGSENGDAYAWDASDPAQAPTIWIAYPGESPVIDLNDDHYLYNFDNGDSPYVQGITFLDGREYVFSSGSGADYFTIIDSTFDGLTNSRPDYNDNQGGYYTYHSGAGYYLTFQGNTFTNFNGVHCIGSLYDQQYTLIEDNSFTNYTAGSLFSAVLALKVGLANFTLRNNFVSCSSCNAYGASFNSPFIDGTSYGLGPKSDNIEICFNYFNTGSGNIEYNRYGDQGEIWTYRNTFVGQVQMTNVDGSACNGPWSFDNNVFQNTAEGLTWHYSCSGDYETCVSQTSNLTGASGLVDSGGLLVNREYVGIYGWETVSQRQKTYNAGSPAATYNAGAAAWTLAE